MDSMATDETQKTPSEAENTASPTPASQPQPVEQAVSQPVSLDEITSDVEEKKPADPFARLKKKKVAVPQALRDSSGVTGGKVKAGTKMSPRIFLI